MSSRHWITVIAFTMFVGHAASAVAGADDWHGSGWQGSAYGVWGGGFRRDSIAGVYGDSAFDYDPYAPYRNDRGCFRLLPIATPAGVRLRRIFVCDF